jgi:prepilin-type N-terminal cleavage/methylation domain-containing protein/prepilin-type processing-associated H-X9-DG protein
MNGIACFLSVAGTWTISAGVIAVFALGLLALACHSVATSPAAAEVLGRLRERVERLRRHGFGPPYRAARSVRFRRQRLTEVRQQLKERGRFADGHVGQLSRDAAPKAGTWGTGARGFTLIELLVVMTIIILLAALLLPALGRAGAKGRQIHCLGNLKQIGAGFHLFANDHGDRFPMQVSTNEGGALEFNQFAPDVAGLFTWTFRNFQVLSNELITPQLLVCRADHRPAASSFATLTDRQVSYFAGRHAEPRQPNSVLSGDDNLTNAATAQSTSTVALAEVNLGWTRARHDQRGNVLFADGRVELLRSLSLRRGAGFPVTGLPRGGPSPRPTATRGVVSPQPAGSDAGDRARSGFTQPEPGPTGLPPALPTANVKTEPSVRVTNTSASGVSYTAVPSAEPREEWDTPRFRFFAFLFKLILILYLLAGAIIVTLYFWKKKKEQETDPGGPV